PDVMPYGTRNAAIWPPSTGSGKTRRASSATSGTRPCAASKQNAPGSIASSPPSSLVVLPAIARSHLEAISGDQGRCVPSADLCSSPPRPRTAGGPDCPADQPLPLARVVIVQDARRPGSPNDAGPGAHLDPDPGMGLDVPDPARAAPALGHRPEGLPSRPSHTGVRTGRPVRTSGGLQQGIARRREAQIVREHDDRVDQ